MSIADNSDHYHVETAIVNNWLLVRRQVASMLKRQRFDLTFEEAMVLHILNEKGGRSLSELALLAGRERTTLSRMIDAMQKRNLVQTVRDKIDKRQKLIYLTSSGRLRHKHAHYCCRRLTEVATQNLSEAEIEATLRVLRKISENLESERSDH